MTLQQSRQDLVKQYHQAIDVLSKFDGITCNSLVRQLLQKSIQELNHRIDHLKKEAGDNA